VGKMQARDEEQDFEVAATVGNDDFGRPNRTECGDLRPAVRKQTTAAWAA